MNLYKKLILVTSFLFLVGCGGDDNASSGENIDVTPIAEAKLTATYELTFTSNWSNNTFPTNFPDNTHFSPLVGLTHNEKGKIFERTSNASQGVILMAETGSKLLLKEEIAAIQNVGNAGKLIDEQGIPVNEKSVTITFEASQDFSLLSIVSMVAPSPDWFVGINSLALFNDKQWVNNETIQLTVYDAGSDNGERFTSDNNKTLPAEVIKQLTTIRANTDFDKGVHYNTKASIGVIKIKWIE